MIRVLDGGPQTTVQDAGRAGQMRYGIPPSGPVDRASFVLANRLVGNADGAAALEFTVLGPRLRAERPCVVAVTGADAPITINERPAPAWTTLALAAGDVLRIGAARRGVRGYVAVAGGIDVAPVLGSRATYLRGRLGGLQGRALKRDDTLSAGPAASPRPRAVPERARPSCDDDAPLRVVLGPQAERFSESGVAAFLGSAYEVLPQSDRMGVRLSGPRIAHTLGHDIISDGIALGAVQVPGDGLPIVLLVDRQSTGGYTKIATVCSFDIRRVGQAKPGQRLRFIAVDIAEAHRLRREAESALADLALQEIAS
ncbi:MAG TPA: biotin-dependent carboxyltransferase family protein [Methylomirabilota bacterium]|nr:biotin-dependent carboxyltransferase family protein [Methylomirabilota bacterium]